MKLTYDKRPERGGDALDELRVVQHQFGHSVSLQHLAVGLGAAVQCQRVRHTTAGGLNVVCSGLY